MPFRFPDTADINEQIEPKGEAVLKKPDFSGRELAKHLIMISLDALSESDWETVRTLPNFQSIIADGTYSTSLKSVFPTHTYVVHTSIVTGTYPDRHGIIHNHQLQPFVPDEDQTWYWYRHEVKVPTLYDLAKKHNMVTAGLLWPVTGKSSIRYNMPELAAIRGESQALKIIRNGSPLYCIGLELRLGKKRVSMEQPHLDDFVALCAVDTIKRKKPNLMLVHLTDLDSTKHKCRTDSPEVDRSLERLDRRIGEILDAVRATGIYDDTAFILLGDHGQINVDHNVHLNNLLRDAGFIYEENGRPAWKAYLQTTGGNAYLHVKDNDKEVEREAVDLLRRAMDAGRYGIEAIYDRAELDRLRAPKEISYVVEARPGYHFCDELHEQTVESYTEQGKKYATHGYSPEKPGYKCIFLAFGPGIKKGFDAGPIEMVDIAPTAARILGMDFYACDGRVLDEIIDKKT